MAVYRLGPRARKDLREIGAFTRRRWGELVLKRFLAALDEKISRYAENPAMGRVRDDLYPGLRSLQYEEFLVFYLTTDAGIHVVRVLHGRRDLDSAF